MDLVFLGINDYGMDIYQWLCDRDGVTVRALATTRDQLELIPQLEPDAVVSAGYQNIVPPEILTVPDRGCINVHPGYLPATRGFNPNVWSIVEDQPAGVTIHYMDEGVDTGDVVARQTVEKTFADDGESLYRRIEKAAFDLFVDTWPEFESGEVEAEPQTESGRTHVKQDFLDLCEIDPSDTYAAKELLDILRALTFPPYDNAYVDVDGERYFIDVSIRPAGESADGRSSGFVIEYD